MESEEVPTIKTESLIVYLSLMGADENAIHRAETLERYAHAAYTGNSDKYCQFCLRLPDHLVTCDCGEKLCEYCMCICKRQSDRLLGFSVGYTE
jgi:hypothetical protein